MAGVGTAYVSVRVDTSKFEGDLGKMLTRLTAQMNKAGDNLGKEMVKGLKGADWDSGFKGLSDSAGKAATNAVKSLDRIDTKADGTARAVRRSADRMVLALGDVKDEARDAGDALGDIRSELTGAATAARRINIGGGGGGGGFGSLRKGGDDANFFRTALSNLAKNAEKSRALLAGLFDTAAFGGSALGALVGGASGAAQGLFALGANAAAMVPALSVATTGILMLAQAGATLKLAFAGVGDAIKAGVEETTPGTAAYNAAAEAATGAGEALKKTVKPAHVSRDAIRSAKEAVIDAARGIEDAKEDMRRAYQDAGQAASDAARRVRRAEADLADSQGATLAAQQALNDARAEALEQLEDIAFAAEDAALGEERAEIALEEAYARLVEVSELSPDNKARQEAELAFKEAELGLRQAKDAREDADAAQQQAAETGIEGTEAMRDAHADLISAQEDEAASAQALADAQREQGRTTIDNARSIQDAEQALADARAAHKDALAGVIEAQKEYRQALKDAAAAAAEANKAIKLQNAEIAAAPPVLSAFEKAMNDMSPAQQEFINRIIALHDEWIEARKEIANPLFEGLNDALTTLLQGDFLGILKDGLVGTSTVMGQLARDAADLVEEGPFKQSFGDVMKSNNKSLENFGGAGLNLADSFIQIADAASPLLEDLSKWAETLTEGWKKSIRAQNANGDLTKSFETGAERVKEWWALGTELWKTLRKLGDAANEASNQWDSLNDKDATKGFIPNMTENLKEFRKGLKHKDLVDDFTTSLDILASVGRTVNTLLIEPLTAMGKDENFRKAFDKFSTPEVSANMKKISDSAGTAAPKIADIAVSVLDIVAAMSESKAIDHFLDIISGVADVLASITGFAADTGILKITGYITGMYAAWRIFKKGFTIVTSPFAAMLDSALKFKDNLKSGGFKSAVKGMFGGKTTGAGDEAKAMKDGEDITQAFAKGIKAGMVHKDAAMKALRKNVETELNKIVTTQTDNAIRVGNALMEGLEKGITTGKIEVLVKATDAGRDVAKAVGKGAGTMSPSTITLKDGNDIMEGLELGIKSGTAEAQATAMASGAKVGNAVGNSAKGAAVTSTAGMGPAMSTSATSSMGRSSGRMAGAMTKMLTPLKAVARGFGGLMTLAMGPFGIAIELIILLLPVIIPLLKKLEEKTGIFSKTLGFLKDALGWVWDKIKDLFNWVKDNWPLILTILTGPIGLAVSQIIKHWDDIKAAVSAAVHFVKGLLSKIWDGITAGWDAVMTFMDEIWSVHLQPKIQALIDKAGELLTGIWDGIKDAWWQLVEWSDILEAWVGDKIQNLVDKAKNVLKNIWEIVKDKWAELKTWAGGLWGSISGKFNDLITSAGGVLKDIWDKIKSAWTNLGTFFSNLWGDIKDYIVGDNGLIGKAGAQLEKIWDKISGAWGAVKSFMSGLWGDIKDYIVGDDGLVGKMSSALTGVWDGLGGGLATAWNAVAKWVNTHVIGGINDLLDKFGGGSIDFKLPENLAAPGKAEGGPITGPGGPKDDKILIRASAGEYMLPAKSARSLGPVALEHMRKTGTLPMGDPGIFGFVGNAFNSVKDALSEGAETAVKWIINNAVDHLPGGLLGQIMKSFFEWAADKIIAWGKDKEDKYMATQAALAGSSVFVPDPTNPTGIGYWKGGTFTRRFVEHMKAAEKIAGVSIVVIQGGFRPATSYSGTSHQGDAIDTIVSAALIRALRRVGIAAGDRTGLGNWGPHVHAIPGPAAGRAGGSAIWQWSDYMARGGASQPLNSTWGLAKGGVVAPRAGGLMALIAEGGKAERVTPLDREGFSPAERKMVEILEQKLAGGVGGGDTYHIQPSTPINEAQLADMVSRRVSWNRRRGARA